jgi:putative DNA primase/helicase
MGLHFNIEAPANGRIHKATVVVLDDEGTVKLTDKGDLLSLPERQKVAKRVAAQLGLDAGEVLRHLELGWSRAMEGRFAPARAQPPPPEDRPHEAGDDPHYLARLFADDHQHEDGPTLLCWREEWYVWNGRSWETVPERDMKARLCRRIKAEFDRQNLEAIRRWHDDGQPGPKPAAHRVTTRLLADAMQALVSLVLLPAKTEAPSWLRPGPGELNECDPAEILVCANGMGHLSGLATDGTLYRCTPSFFGLNALLYDYLETAPAPVLWLEFLGKLWSNDLTAIEALQEFFGYALTPDTSQQKILMIVGPKRSGKGTIARILRALVGIHNTCSPTLAGLATNFGLWPLLGKTVAIISDARLSGRTDAAVIVERLLSISGEDAQTIDRKNLPHVTTRLTTRFVIMTNELPRLTDPSGALAGRLILLRLTESFYGREDTTLTDRLLAELPGILLWAIEGWQRFRQRGHFLQPESGRKLIEDMEDLSSPIGAFVRERCEVGPGFEVFVRDLFTEWKSWCEEKGRKDPGNEQTFGRDLRAHLPALDVRQPRDGDKRVRVYVGLKIRW